MNNTINNTSFKLGNDVRFPDDSLQFFIDINDISDELDKQIQNAIEENKLYYTYYISKDKGNEWSETGVNIIGVSLNVFVKEDKQLECKIEVAYEDKVNPVLWSDVSIKVDLAAYETELKQLMLAAIMDKFFN